MKAEDYQLFFSALSNKNRLKIVNFLRKGPTSVNEIVSSTGLKQANVSRSLACLLQCGFVDVSQKGRRRMYKLNGSTRPLLSAADRHMKFYIGRARACKKL